MLDKISGVDKYSIVVKISVVDLISVLAKTSVQWLQIRRNFSSRHFFMVDEISVVDWFSVVDYFSKQNDRRKFSSRLIFLRHTKWYRRNFRCILFCGWPSKQSKAEDKFLAEDFSCLDLTVTYHTHILR